MPKLEDIPKINNPELKPQLDGHLETVPMAKETAKLELSTEDQLKNLTRESETRQEGISRLTSSVETTKIKLNEAREKLGLPPTEEDPPSVLLEKDRLDKLKTEQNTSEKQREELVSKQEKEKLVKDEKEKILQRKLDELFKEFEALTPKDFGNILQSGKTLEGRNVESKSMGFLDPKVAQSLAKAFKEGVKLLPKILEALPDLLKKFDEDITKEATEAVDKKLEAEKQKIKEEEKKEKKPEEPKLEEKAKILEGEIPLNEGKQEPDLANL